MFSFNSINSNEYLTVNKIRRSLLPPIARSYTEIPGLIGAHLSNSKLGIGRFDIDVTIHDDLLNDYENLKRNIAAWLYTENAELLIFPKDQNIYYYGALDGNTDLEEVATLGQGTLSFLCSNPLGIGPEAFMNFANDEASLNIEGTYKTYPRIRSMFTSPANEFKITHAQQGKYVRVPRKFVAGDVLEIDFATDKVLLNGLVIVYDWVLSEMFPLEKGPQLLNVTPTGVTNTTIYWRPRWL